MADHHDFFYTKLQDSYQKASYHTSACRRSRGSRPACRSPISRGRIRPPRCCARSSSRRHSSSSSAPRRDAGEPEARPPGASTCRSSPSASPPCRPPRPCARRASRTGRAPEGGAGTLRAGPRGGVNVPGGAGTLRADGREGRASARPRGCATGGVCGKVATCCDHCRHGDTDADRYFKVRQPGQNLNRARVQFRLCEAIEARERSIREILRRF